MDHVENIRKLDDEGKLEICGVFKGYPGMAGMYILKQRAVKKQRKFANQNRWLWEDMQPTS